jgi:hypothetical protein
VDALSTANAEVVDQDHLDWRAVDGKREEWSIRIIQVDALSTANALPRVYASDWIARREWPRAPSGAIAFANPSDSPVDGERVGRRSGSSRWTRCRLRTRRSSTRII